MSWTTSLTQVRHILFVLYLTVYGLLGGNRSETSLTCWAIIEPCSGPWSSPIVQKDGSFRLCVDFRRLNSVTIPDPFCMPLIEDIINQIREAHYLLKKIFPKAFIWCLFLPVIFSTPFGSDVCHSGS